MARRAAIAVEAIERHADVESGMDRLDQSLALGEGLRPLAHELRGREQVGVVGGRVAVMLGERRELGHAMIDGTYRNLPVEERGGIADGRPPIRLRPPRRDS